MSPVSLLPLPLLFGLACAVVWALDKRFPVPLAGGRLHAIDGLRGYLAFAAFLHHACIWYFLLHTGQWGLPPSRVFVHLGQTSVSLFFMITGHLFFAKLLRSRDAPLDWLRLYVSRALRILPVYVLLVLVGGALMWLIQRAQLDAGNPALLADTARKLLVTAGVTWTLQYEWNFYFALPWLALLLGRRVAWWWLVLGALYLARSSLNELSNVHAATFLGGMASAWLGRRPGVQALCQRPWASALALALLVAVVALFDGAYAAWPLALLAVAFGLIANGADLFGLLSSRLSRVFGELTYSLYLLHGLLLFLCFRFVVGLSTATGLSGSGHWLVVAALTPVLMAVAFCSFRCIETPAMRQTERLTAWLRRRVARGKLAQDKAA